MQVTRSSVTLSGQISRGSQRMPNDSYHRKRAKELGAIEAKALVATIPGLIGILGSRELKQVQMLLDAAILNPVLRKEYQDADLAAIAAQSGQLVMRDPAKQRRADRLFERIIPFRRLTTGSGSTSPRC
jgi:hypothetical protein